MFARFRLGLAVSITLAGACAAGDIFEQPYTDSPDPGSPCSIDGQQVADEFILPTAVGTADLWWYGSFATADPFDQPTLMQFRLRIFADNAGNPAEIPFRDFDFFIALATPTGMQSSDGRAVYRFLAIDWMLNLPANERLYISILEDDPGFADGEYRWANSTTQTGDLNWLRNADSENWQAIGGFRGQSAFGMSIPAPAPLSALAGAGLVTCRSRRRRLPGGP